TLLGYEVREYLLEK
ncbi:hypothetical protein, partial [Vreelandella rituensis]